MGARRGGDKGVAAAAAAISVAGAQIEWADVGEVIRRFRESGLSERDLWAVTKVVEPFVRLGGGPDDEPLVAPAAPPSGGEPPVTPEAGPASDPLPDLKAWAKQEVERETGQALVRVERGETYRTPSGYLAHLRSMRPYDRGSGRVSYWFGLAEDRWQDGDVFILVCGTDGVLVVPVGEWLKYKPLMARAKDNTELQPNIWLVDGNFEMRAQGQHIDVSEWVNRFDLL